MKLKNCLVIIVSGLSICTAFAMENTVKEDKPTTKIVDYRQRHYCARDKSGKHLGCIGYEKNDCIINYFSSKELAAAELLFGRAVVSLVKSGCKAIGISNFQIDDYEFFKQKNADSVPCANMHNEYTMGLQRMCLQNANSLTVTKKNKDIVLQKTKLGGNDYRLFYLVASNSNQIIGEATFYSKRCYLNSLSVNEAYQRKGFGKLLFHTAMDIMRQKGCDRASWTSYQSAIEFYKKQGAVLDDNQKMHMDLRKDQKPANKA